MPRPATHTRYRRLAAACAALAAVVLLGCQQQRTEIELDADQEAALIQFLTPATIEVASFTQPISVAGDGQPDAVEAILIVKDAAGHDTKVLGTFQFELLRQRLTTADKLPERVSYWRVPINTVEAYHEFWDPYSRNYRFILALEPGSLPPGEYALEASFTSLAGEHQFARREFTVDGTPVSPLNPRYAVP